MVTTSFKVSKEILDLYRHLSIFYPPYNHITKVNQLETLKILLKIGSRSSLPDDLECNETPSTYRRSQRSTLRSSDSLCSYYQKSKVTKTPSLTENLKNVKGK